jgi:hypothetical protein
MSAVQARIHYSMKQEFRLLKTIIADYTPEEYSYEPADGDRQTKKSDYEAVDVIPVSDPNASTMAQKVVQYQAVIQLAQSAPQIYDLPELHREMIEVLGVKNAKKLIPGKEDQKPRDPLTENMNVINGRPLKAFMYQDHAAHIQAHNAFLQDPTTAATMGQNPMAQQISATMQAHIAEHFGFQYRQKIEQQIGSPLPYEEDVDAKALPEDYEIQMSRLVAQASQQLLQQNQAQAAQQQAQQQAEDPMIQMAKQELVIKDKEVQRKALKDKQEVQIKQEQLNIEKQKLSLENRKASAAAEANGFKLSSSAEEAKRRLEQDMTKFRAQQEADGIKTGLSVAEQLARPKPTKGE